MESIIGSVKSLDKITVHSPFLSILPLFCILPPKICISHLSTFHLYFIFHCRDNMMKINTFSMTVSKTYCLFHFQTEICFFHIFSFGQCLAPEKMLFACEYFLVLLLLNLNILKTLKNSLNGTFFKFSEKFG